jgi:hypothetical protein
MNCQLCLEPFDTSFRKPYHLSCPHTFCIICLNDLKENVCPNCKKLITEKHPNEAIIELMLKTKNEKLNQINKQLNHLKASNSYLDNSQIISAASSGSIVQKGIVQNKPSKAIGLSSNDQKKTIQNKTSKAKALSSNDQKENVQNKQSKASAYSLIFQKGIVQSVPSKAITLGSIDQKSAFQNKPSKAIAIGSNDQKKTIQNKLSKASAYISTDPKSSIQYKTSKAINNRNINISKVKNQFFRVSSIFIPRIPTANNNRKIEAKNRLKHKKIIKKVNIFRNQAKKTVKRLIKPAKYLTEKEFFIKKFYHGKRKSTRKCKRNIVKRKKEYFCPLADKYFQGFNFLKPKN